ncbi:MAG: family 43 glycosylhydrolase [Firmicutes bacterium]|nr:family 43 glycosylhydrolase [Bacillota bacterium]
MKKRLLILLSIAMALMLGACGFLPSSANRGGDQIPDWVPHTEMAMPSNAYHDQMDGVINRSLFAYNELTALAPDPSVIYSHTGGDGGWFYMYGTSDDIGTNGFQVWRSRDLSLWEDMGPAFLPRRDGWAIENHWAPEVIYHAGYYFLFYNAWEDDRPYRRHAIGLAVARHPLGPFIAVNDGLAPLFDADNLPDTVIVGHNPVRRIRGQALIDASPFIDNVWCSTANSYIYRYYLFVTADVQLPTNQAGHPGGGGLNASSQWGMELTFIPGNGDDIFPTFAPIYETTVQITRTNFARVDSASPMGYVDVLRNAQFQNYTNEGGFLWRHDKPDGTPQYFFTFSVAQFWMPQYSVMQAVGPTPLGPFEKVPIRDGGLLLTGWNIGDAGNWDQNADAWRSLEVFGGAGHHSFVRAGNELFIAYHVITGFWTFPYSPIRHAAVDRVQFIENSAGQTVMYINGPTKSIQPLPYAVSGYKNLALDATFSVPTTGVGSIAVGSSIEYLNDGLFLNHSFNRHLIGETMFNGNSTVITVDFDEYVDVRSVMIYNAHFFENSFDQINRVSFRTRIDDEQGRPLLDGLLHINNLRFDWDRHTIETTRSLPSEQFIINPGSAAVAEFNAIRTNQIIIEVSRGALAMAHVPGANLVIPEIVILGITVT